MGLPSPPPRPPGPGTCLACPIRERSVCAICAPPELAELEAMKSYRAYPPGATIAHPEAPLGFVGSVVEGHVSLKRVMADGRQQIVGLLFPSDFLGRPFRASVPYEAQAVGQVLLCTFDRLRFERLMRESPAVERRLLAMTLDELDAARETFLLLGRKTARERVASFLLLLARRSGDAPVLELPLGREEMSEILGLTLETVSRQMTALRRDGTIALTGPRSVAVRDPAALLEAAGSEPAGG